MSARKNSERYTMSSGEMGLRQTYITFQFIGSLYESKGFKAGDFSEAERFHQEAISIPMYSGLSQQQQDTVIKVLRNIFA